MSTLPNQPTFGDPKTDIVSDSTAIVNEAALKDLAKINAYIESPDNMDNLADLLKKNFGRELESQLTNGETGLYKITLLAKSTSELEKKLNTKKSKIEKSADPKTKDELTLDIAGLTSLKKTIETSLKNNTTIIENQHEIEKKLLKLQRGTKGVDKDDINVKYKSLTLNENNIPTFKYEVAGESVALELTNGKINVNKGNIKIDDTYYKINQGLELEKDTEGKLNELKDYKAEGGDVAIKKIDNGFETTFTLKDKKTVVFNLDQNGLINGSKTREENGYKLNINQKNKTFKLTDMNPKEPEVNTETKDDTDEVKTLKNERESIKNKEGELTSKERDRLQAINKSIETQKKINKELSEIEDQIEKKKEEIKELDKAYRTADAEGMKKIDLEIEKIQSEIQEIEKKEEFINKDLDTKILIKDNQEFLKDFNKSLILNNISNKDWYDKNEKISKIGDITKLLTEELTKNKENDSIKGLIKLLKGGDIEGFQKRIYQETKYKSNYKNPIDGNLGGETFTVLKKYIELINSDDNTKNEKEGNTPDIQGSEVPQNESTTQLQKEEKKNNNAKKQTTISKNGNKTKKVEKTKGEKTEETDKTYTQNENETGDKRKKLTNTLTDSKLTSTIDSRGLDFNGTYAGDTASKKEFIENIKKEKKILSEDRIAGLKIYLTNLGYIDSDLGIDYSTASQKYLSNNDNINNAIKKYLNDESILTTTLEDNTVINSINNRNLDYTGMGTNDISSGKAFSNFILKEFKDNHIEITHEKLGGLREYLETEGIIDNAGNIDYRNGEYTSNKKVEEAISNYLKD